MAGDVLRPRTLRPALEGAETAYYLIHSMWSGSGFEDKEFGNTLVVNGVWLEDPATALLW